MVSRALPDQWERDILNFWFEELSPKDWFVQDIAVDLALTSRFYDLFEHVSTALPQMCETSAKAALAAIIVLDQFPRNMFRNQAKAFDTDDKALELAQGTISRGLDKKLPIEQRQFIYMPFMHSEEPFVQARSIKLFTALASASNLKFAIAHKDIIDRFGRFPHRNEMLGRVSSSEEILFLKQSGSSF